MRKLLIIASLLLVVVMFASGLDTLKTLSKSKLELRETSFDFGVAPGGQRMTHHFLLRSVGEEPLLIQQVRATCGCTNAPLANDSISPGDSTELKVTFNSSGYSGRKARKSVKITSNDMDKKVHSVSFTVNVDTLKYTVMKPNPFFIDLGREDHFQKESQVIVKNVMKDGDPIELSVITYDFDVIKSVTIEDSKLKAGEETIISIVLIDDIAPKARIQSSFTIEANDASNSRITIPIRGGIVSQKGRHTNKPKNTRPPKNK